MTVLYVIGGVFIAFAVWKFIGSVWQNDLDAHDSAPGEGSTD